MLPATASVARIGTSAIVSRCPELLQLTLQRQAQETEQEEDLSLFEKVENIGALGSDPGLYAFQRGKDWYWKPGAKIDPEYRQYLAERRAGLQQEDLSYQEYLRKYHANRPDRFGRTPVDLAKMPSAQKYYLVLEHPDAEVRKYYRAVGIIGTEDKDWFRGEMDRYLTYLGLANSLWVPVPPCTTVAGGAARWAAVEAAKRKGLYEAARRVVLRKLAQKAGTVVDEALETSLRRSGFSEDTILRWRASGYEMTAAGMSRGKALEKIMEKIPTIEEHFGKIAANPNSQALNHWRGEIRARLREMEEYLPVLGRKTSEEWTRRIAEWRARLGDL